MSAEALSDPLGSAESLSFLMAVKQQQITSMGARGTLSTALAKEVFFTEGPVRYWDVFDRIALRGGELRM